MRAYVSLSPSEAEFKNGIREVVAGFENTIGRCTLLSSNILNQSTDNISRVERKTVVTQTYF